MKRIIVIGLLCIAIVSMMATGRKVLFIGDSITDGGWGRSGGSMAPSEKRNHTDWNHLYDIAT